jgi:hypothetical protein
MLTLTLATPLPVAPSLAVPQIAPPAEHAPGHAVSPL